MGSVPWFRPPVVTGLALALLVAGLVGYGLSYTANRGDYLVTQPVVAAERDYLEESRENYAAVYAEYSAVQLHQGAVRYGIESQRATVSPSNANQNITGRVASMLGTLSDSNARLAKAIETYNNAALHLDTDTLNQARLPMKLYVEGGRVIEEVSDNHP